METFQRKNLRLLDYDYSTNGAYFITICVENKRPLLWDPSCSLPLLSENCIPLSDTGRIVDEAIRNIPKAYPYVFVEKYIVMPDHVHILMVVESEKTAGKSISHIISQFKGYVTKRLKMSIWQKSFYDRIIRDDKEFGEAWRYIDNNPFTLEKN